MTPTASPASTPNTSLYAEIGCTPVIVGRHYSAYPANFSRNLFFIASHGSSFTMESWGRENTAQAIAWLDARQDEHLAAIAAAQARRQLDGVPANLLRRGDVIADPHALNAGDHPLAIVDVRPHHNGDIKTMAEDGEGRPRTVFFKPEEIVRVVERVGTTDPKVSAN